MTAWEAMVLTMRLHPEFVKQLRQEVLEAAASHIETTAEEIYNREFGEYARIDHGTRLQLAALTDAAEWVRTMEDK